MFKKSYSQEELNNILAKTAKRKGWDFSIMKTSCQQVPWEYLDIVKKYLKTSFRVLDIGTGGGERFLKLARYLKSGVGIDNDPEMVETAIENGKRYNQFSFYLDNDSLEKTDGLFDVILNRHAPYKLSAINEHLSPGGYFITQQVGEKNMLNIKRVLGQKIDEPDISPNMIEGSGAKLIAFMEYDVEYIVHDIESLIFWLNALDSAHADISGGSAIKNADLFNKILEGNVDDRGFITNEQRYLAIIQKRI